ncbi:MAG: hypothetical protein ABIN91_19770 [Mucilaginibacter sp.]|uniref:hypothetical protein n=1 Tax=Mucilaginibacter sp. TaxID=1882438 RepID=UPI0032635B6C
MLHYIAKTRLIVLLLMLSAAPVLGQVVYEPQILILSPGATKFDGAFEKQIADITAKLKKDIKPGDREKVLQSPRFKEQAENLRIMTLNQLDYALKVDFFKQMPLMTASYLSYRFYERFPNLMVRIKDVQSDGSLASLKAIAAGDNLQYVMNFPSVEFYKDKGVNVAKITVQLFNKNTGTLLLNKAYTGDARNHGFETTCEDGTLNCNLINALSQGYAEVVKIVAENNPAIIRERQLSGLRANTLRTYLTYPYDATLLKQVTGADSTIEQGAVYQCLYNSDKTKFVAFFLKQVKAGKGGLLGVANGSNDNNVKVLTNKKIGDKGYLDQSPQKYAYTVTGVKYQGKWYFVKDNATYFEADNLQEARAQYFNSLQSFNFFKANSTDFNPQFWETKLFEKVPDLTKDPEWAKYGKSIWKNEEIENRPYIGMYKVVADKMREGK